MKHAAHTTHKGGHHSLTILSQLTDLRVISAGSSRASRTAVSDLTWQRAQSESIQRDDFRTVWHTGHVTAILSNEVDVIAATQTGGVWLLSSVLEPTPLAGYTGNSLSDSWDTPDISCLAWGVESGQVYVGTTAQGLHLLQFTTVLGGHLSYMGSVTLAVPFYAAVAIIVLNDPGRIVVLTSSGAWWSPIPGVATDSSAYAWKSAQMLPIANYTGLAAGPGASVAVAGFGGLPTGIKTPPPGGAIFRGTFQGGELVFSPATIKGLDVSLMRTTSLASCEDQPDHMYAVAAGTDNQVLGVLASTDGGARWLVRSAPSKAAAGYQGFYNNCIAVSPQHPNQVVIGWLSGGAFFSDDSAISWRHPNTQESNPNLHNDLHALCFTRNSAVFVGGDGGIAVTSDQGITYQSQFNRQLHDLQFYGGSHPSSLGDYGGSLTASSRYPGLLAGGTQDNGNIYRLPDTDRDDSIPRQADTAWFRHVGGDGGLNRFVDPLGALLNIDNTNVNVGLTLWDESSNRFPPGPGTIIPADDSPGGIPPSAIELVRNPAFKKANQLMYAAVASTTKGAIYGLFADTPKKDLPEATNAKLIRLGSVGGLVTAMASRDGSTLMVGTDSGQIFDFNSANGAATPYTLPDQAGAGVVYGIELFPAPLLAGSLPDNAFALMGGQILYFNGLFWSTTTGTDWQTIAYDVESKRLFAATDADVFFSTDHGKSWTDASFGLPARAHCVDLRIASDRHGGLYLSTYGHSVWRATISQHPRIVEVPPDVAQIILGVLGDGGGLVRIGKEIHRLPPQPVLRDIMVALVMENMASSMSEQSAANRRALQIAALQQIAEIALREAGRLR